MKATGAIRTIDKLGRVVIPSEYRKFLNIRSDDDVEVTLTAEGVLLRRLKPCCVLCGQKDSLVKIAGGYLCPDCISAVKQL